MYIEINMNTTLPTQLFCVVGSGAQSLRPAEIGYFAHVITINENVFRLEVSVCYCNTMQSSDSFDDAAEVVSALRKKSSHLGTSIYIYIYIPLSLSPLLQLQGF